MRAHTPTRARVSTRPDTSGGEGWQEQHDRPPPQRPQGQRSSSAARSTLRIVCLQFIGWCAAGRSHSLCFLPPSLTPVFSIPISPPVVNSNCIMAGLVAFWMPIGVGSRVGSPERMNALTLCVRSANTRWLRFHLTCAYVRARVCMYRARHARWPPRRIRTICLIGIIVLVGEDDRDANWNQMTRDAPLANDGLFVPWCTAMRFVRTYIDLVTVLPLLVRFEDKCVACIIRAAALPANSQLQL